MISINSAAPLSSAFSRLPNSERRNYFKIYVAWPQPTTLTLFWTTFFAITETLTFCFRNTIGLFLSTIICTDVSLCLKWTFPVFLVLKSHEGLISNVTEQTQLQFWEAQWKIGTLYSKGNKQEWLKTLKCKTYSFLLTVPLSTWNGVFLCFI